MKKVTVNYLKEVCESYINREISRVTWKDGSISDDPDLYLGIVNFGVCICGKNSLWSREVIYAEEIEFK